MTDQITIPRALLEQALEALEIATEDYDDSAVGLEIDAIQALRAELAKPVEPADLPTPTPAWHDAPEVTDLKAQRDELLALLIYASSEIKSEVI